MLTRLMQAAIMAAWAVFFIWMFAFDQPTLSRLLHPRLWWLILGGAMVLIIFCGLALSRLRVPPEKVLCWTWPTYLALVVPILFVGQMRSARFDSQTFFDRTASPIETSSLQLEDANSPTTEPTDATAPPDVSFSQIFQAPQQYAGRKVEVLCQALTDPSLPENQFICYRFRINCCAADAQPVFVFVNRQGFRAPEKDAWVRVRGRLYTHKADSITFPVVRAEEILSEAEPSFPFVF